MEDRERNSAFTLIEVLFVITMIGILAAIAIIRYGPMAENARAAEAWTVLSQIKDSENVYRLENNVYTTFPNLLDRFDAAPVSTNFTFTIPSANLNSGYAQAARVPAPGRNSYGICLNGGRRQTCLGADACNPGCP